MRAESRLREEVRPRDQLGPRALERPWPELAYPLNSNRLPEEYVLNPRLKTHHARPL